MQCGGSPVLVSMYHSRKRRFAKVDLLEHLQSQQHLSSAVPRIEMEARPRHLAATIFDCVASSADSLLLRLECVLGVASSQGGGAVRFVAAEGAPHAEQRADAAGQHAARRGRW